MARSQYGQALRWGIFLKALALIVSPEMAVSGISCFITVNWTVPDPAAFRTGQKDLSVPEPRLPTPGADGGHVVFYQIYAPTAYKVAAGSKS